MGWGNAAGGARKGEGVPGGTRGRSEWGEWGRGWSGVADVMLLVESGQAARREGGTEKRGLVESRSAHQTTAHYTRVQEPSQTCVHKD